MHTFSHIVAPTFATVRFALMALLLAMPANAARAQGQFIDIAPNTIDEITLILNTLDQAIASNDADTPPIAMMLHGDTAHQFMRDNYAQNKSIIDQTAKLAGFNIIKVQVCEMWMQENGYEAKDLFPFAQTVPFGAAELERLSNEENYTAYDVEI